MRTLALYAAVAATGLAGCSTASDDPSRAAGSGGLAAGGHTTAGTNSGGGGGSNASSGAAGLPQGGSGAATAGNGGAEVGGAGGAAANAGGGGSNGGAAGNCPSSAPMAAPSVTACPPATGNTPPDTALAAVNDLRAHMGLSCMTLVSQINESAQKHCDYYQQNMANKACIANAHVEVASCAGFVAANFDMRMTAAGYSGSPRSEVMAFSGDPTNAIGQWINSVYHRTPLLSPWIRELGYGMTADCDTIDMGQGTKAPDTLTAVYPYPGQVDVPLSFDGSHEGPTPPAPPTGWPSASPVHLYIKGFTVTSHDVLTGERCDPLPHQWLPDKEQYILYPDEPFTKGTAYRVVIAGTLAGKALTFDWTFTTKN